MTAVLVGAIRWDPWYSQGSTILSASRQAQNQLSPLAWRSRMPWFSTAVNNYQMTANGSQANMDLEIQLAAQAGLSYWSFDTYGIGSGGVTDNPDLSVGLSLYLASSFSSLMKWCCNTTPGQFIGSGGFAATAQWQAVCAQWAAYMTDTRYLKVLTNRPVIHMRWNDSTITGSLYGGYANFQTVMAYLNSLLTTAGLGNVYLVVLAGTGTAAGYLTSAAAQAISGYTSAFTITGSLPLPYSTLDTQTQATWVTLAATGQPIVPICQTGWDLRAQHFTPTPNAPGGGHGPIGANQAFLPGTAAQITADILAAVTYVNANPTIVPSKSVLIYSWTECSEGGSALIPTIGDPPVNTDSGQSLLTSNQLVSLGTALRAAA
jgi:hypothetical protein